MSEQQGNRKNYNNEHGRDNSQEEMEDILASIRKIITDEINEEKAHESGPEEILELTHSIDDIDIDSNKYVGDRHMVHILEGEDNKASPEEAKEENVEEAAVEEEIATQEDSEAAKGADGGGEDEVAAKEALAEEKAEEAVVEEAGPEVAAEEPAPEAKANEEEAMVLDQVADDPQDEILKQAAAESMIDEDNDTKVVDTSNINPKKVSKDLQEEMISTDALSQSTEALSIIDTVTEKVNKHAVHNMGSKTLDGVMQELLQPLLKEWLNANLPSLVKWVVTEQVEKLVKERLRK